MATRPLYNLVAAQLQDDGLPHVAQIVATATLTPFPRPGALPKHALQQQLTGDLGALDLLDASAASVPSYEHSSYFSRLALPQPGLAARFTADGKLFAIGSPDGSVKLLDAWGLLNGRMGDAGPASLLVQTCLPELPFPVRDVEFNPRGGLLVSASQDCTMRFYDVARGALRAKRKCTDTHPIHSIAHHPAGEVLLAATAHPALHIYDLASFRCFLSPVETEHHAAAITQAVWAADGSVFASCSADAIKIWDGATCRCVRTIPLAHSGAAVSSIAFSSSGSFLLSSGGDSCARLWDVGSGRLVRTYEGAMIHSLRATSCFSHDEAHILAVDEASASVIIWSSHSGDVVQRCPGHPRGVGVLCHSPAHAAFLTCSDDGQTRVWTSADL
ncbi:hypothetical protein AB1Y20_009252 [Prymnesium parvum]|uniref:Cleavage stimulation factor 50 kDa subunit n=1 Tax=Prymnesium parvum TaxID=97485 RepID=A0AB34K494_PRYPA